MKTWRLCLRYLMFSLAAMATFGCGAEPADDGAATAVVEEAPRMAESGVPVVTQGELVAALQEGTAPIILDVRSQDEYDAGHIVGAIHIPYDELPARAEEIGAESGDPILVYCRTGRRAGIAEKALTEAGYTNVMDLEGHITAWTESGLPLEMVEAD